MNQFGVGHAEVYGEFPYHPASNSELPTRTKNRKDIHVGSSRDVSTPSKAWCFLQGESPCGERFSQPLLPSVAPKLVTVR